MPQLRSGAHGWRSSVKQDLADCEIKAYLDVFQKVDTLFYWRSQSGCAVDFVLAEDDRPLMAIEVKSKTNPSGKDFAALHALKEEFPDLACIMVCQTPHDLLREDGIRVLTVGSFLGKL
jgi:predicted AAA+ superfamily ATPase